MNEKEEMEDSHHHPAYLWRAHQVKEYVEGIMDEKDRALEMADIERAKAAEVLRDTQQRALDQATDEREKAAAALREQLSDRIAAGDNNLREHILAQISQLRIMIENSEALSKTRHESTQREAKIQHDADQAAISKAEAANETRFHATNEWRAQSADRERSQQEQIALFIATLTPLAKTEALEDKLISLIDRNQKDLASLANKFDIKQGESQGVKITTSFIVTAITMSIGIIGIIVVLANYFTSP